MAEGTERKSKDCCCQIWIWPSSSSSSDKSIFQAFRPLAVLTWIFGLFPVQNVLVGPYSHRNKCCYLCSVILSIFMLVPLVVCAVFFVRFRLYREKELNTMDVAGMMLLLNRVVHSMLQYWLVTLRRRKISNLFLRLHQYDELMKSHVNNVLSSRAWYSLFMVFFYVVTIQVIEYLYMVEYTVPLVIHLLSFIFLMYASVIPVIPIIHVLFLSKALFFRIQHTNKVLERVLGKLPRNTAIKSKNDREDAIAICPDLDSTEELSHLLSCYAEMADLVQVTSDTYGLCITVTFFSFLVQIVTGFAVVLYIMKYIGMLIIQVATDTVVSVALLLCIANFMQNIPEEAARLYYDLFRVNLPSLKPECRMQVEYLMKMMSGPPVQMTAAGFFIINRSLITSIASAIATYLIVLAQFRGAEGPNSYCKDAQNNYSDFPVDMSTLNHSTNDSGFYVCKFMSRTEL